jgi:hypothetical protein
LGEVDRAFTEPKGEFTPFRFNFAHPSAVSSIRTPEEAMEPLRIPMDHTLAHRLEALALLQREALPGLPYDEEDAAHQALQRGVDVMLAEFLGGRQGRGPQADG